MVLTNSARFRGHTGLEGASAFLLKTPSGNIMAATALHLIGENGGVEPEIPIHKLDRVLESWSLYPRTRPNEAIRAMGLGFDSMPAKDLDWLILRVDQSLLPKSVYALTARSRPVQIGETVFLVGASYSEPKVAQKVYSGKVTERAFSHNFRFEISPPVDIRGFSGAPIVDKDGLVVGVTSIWFEQKIVDDLWTEAGGEDAASVIPLLK